MFSYSSHILTVLLLGILVTMVGCTRQTIDSSCIDHAKWCLKLGRKVPLSRCYEARHRARCCHSCQKLKLPWKDCEYGDRQPSLCSSIDRSRPIGDCYSDNRTCCQTCQLYNTGIPGCPFGDRASWCDGIGDRYSISSCYDHEIHCCKTCMNFRTGIPGDTSEDTSCRYGDRAAWCTMIGDTMPMSSCEENAGVCCETCKLLKEAQEKFPLSESNPPSVSPTKSSSPSSTFHYTDRRLTATQTPPINPIKDSGTTVSTTHNKNTLPPKEQPRHSNKQLNSTSTLPWIYHGNITYAAGEGDNSSTYNYYWLGGTNGGSEKDTSNGNPNEMSPDKKHTQQQHSNSIMSNQTGKGNVDSANNNNHHPSNKTADINSDQSHSIDSDISNLLNDTSDNDLQNSDSTESQLPVIEKDEETMLLNGVSSGSRRLQVEDIIKFIPLLLTSYVYICSHIYTQLHSQLYS